MEHHIILRSTSHGALDLYIDNVYVSPVRSWNVHNHSPDGFQVGYLGSGPAQTALAIMLHTTNTQHHYQDFKTEFVAHWKPDTEYVVNVREWLRNR